MTPPRRNLPRAFGAIFALIVLVLVAVLNTWAALDEIANNTLSAWVTHGGRMTAAIPFGLAGVFGHWASRGHGLPAPPGGPIPFLACVAALLALDAITGGEAARYGWWVWGAIGVGMGAVMWPMASVAG